MTVFILLILFLAVGRTAAAQSFAVFDIPNALLTYPLSINNRGDVTECFEDMHAL